jgi:endonuclease/exonuclease/phosphatase family metal-dependent hydrolase
VREEPGRHSNRQRRGATGILVALGLLVAVGATTAAVATPLLDGADDAPSEAAVLSRPAELESAVASPRDEAPVDRAAVRTAPPQRVVPAKTVKRKPAKVIKQQAELRARAEAAAKPVSFRIATFNVLGSQHTAPGGDRRRFPSASWRTPQAAGLIGKHGADVIGTQELQADQLDGLQRLTGFAAYPGYAFGSKKTDNSILYDPAKFEFVDGSSFDITFMNGRHPQTVLKLRERSTGREMYFVNMHTSAGHDRRNTGTRIAGHLTGAAVVNDLQATGLPVFVTGDMNDRVEFFCRFLPRTGMVAAIGGSTAGGCHPPGHLAVDWITASNDVGFSNYWEDGTPQARKISDHYFVSAVATVAAAAKR